MRAPFPVVTRDDNINQNVLIFCSILYFQTKEQIDASIITHTRHSQSNPIQLNFNRTQSNSIETNPWIEFDWFLQSNEIELTQKKLGNRTQLNLINWIVFDWVRWPNPIEHNPMDWVRWVRFLTQSSMFDFVRLPNSIELNPWIEFDWVRLGSISERSIEYAGHTQYYKYWNKTCPHIFPSQVHKILKPL